MIEGRSLLLRVRLAARNTLRNGRRTALNLFMIAAGLCAIVLFKGFTHHILMLVRETLISNELGHLQIAKTSFWRRTEENPVHSMLTEHATLTESLKGGPHVRSISGRITFFGLLSVGEKSLAGRILAYDPTVERDVLGRYPMHQGRTIATSDQPEVTLGVGLATRLGATIGEKLVLLTHTADGILNGVETEVSGIFRSGIADLDDSTLFLPLKVAQTLLETQAVDRIVVMLDETSRTDAVKARIQGALAAKHPELEVKSWSQLGKMYQQVKEFYASYNGMLHGIILSLLVVGTLNTIGMSIFERTGEIGTQLALGETRAQIISLFATEGMILGLLGSVIGGLAAIAIASFVNQLGIPLTLPRTSAPIPLKILLLPGAFLEAALLSVLMAVIASLIPAFRATRIPIVDALRKNVAR